MIRGQDILVLLRLWGADSPDWSLASVGDGLELASSAVFRALERLGRAGLYDPRAHRIRHAQGHEFMVHASRYLFPPDFDGESRGVPAAWSAPPLRDRLASGDGLPVVWAHPAGEVRGIALEPVHRNVPNIAIRDADMAELLAIFDGLRAGDARVRDVAADELLARAAPAFHA
jgi:hypothetical protein